MTAKLTPTEKDILEHLADAWNLFNTLLAHHPQERPQFLAAIHTAQAIIGTRVAHRTEPNFWRYVNIPPSPEKEEAPS